MVRPPSPFVQCRLLAFGCFAFFVRLEHLGAPSHEARSRGGEGGDGRGVEVGKGMGVLTLFNP